MHLLLVRRAACGVRQPATCNNPPTSSSSSHLGDPREELPTRLLLCGALDVGLSASPD